MLAGEHESWIPALNRASGTPTRSRWTAWDPCSKSRSRWDAAVIIFVLYVALMLPPQIAFGNPQKINALRMIDFFVDMFFFVDVYVTLRTGFFKQDKATGLWSLELDPWTCMKRYLYGWFAVDVISIFPTDVVLLAFPDTFRGVNPSLSRLPRCFKLLRLPRLFRYIRKWQELIPCSPIVLQLMTCIWVMLIFAHIAACFIILAADLEGFPDESWMVVYDLLVEPQWKQYVYGLFISLSHLMCLGYGLSSIPGTFVELCVTMVSMTFGSVLFLLVVGTLPTAVLESEVAAAADAMDGEGLPLPSARRHSKRARLASNLGAYAAGGLQPRWRSTMQTTAAPVGTSTDQARQYAEHSSKALELLKPHPEESPAPSPASPGRARRSTDTHRSRLRRSYSAGERADYNYELITSAFQAPSNRLDL